MLCFHYLLRLVLAIYYCHKQVVSQLYKIYFEVKVCDYRAMIAKYLYHCTHYILSPTRHAFCCVTGQFFYKKNPLLKK